MAKNFNDRRQNSTETVHLGTYLHPSEDMLVLKLEHKDIPYPNSPVLFNSNQIGKVEEVFGPKEGVFVAVKLDSGVNLKDFKIESKFEAYKDKFIFKDKFLPREEVEKNKEKNDKKNFAVKGFKSGSRDKFKGKGDYSNGNRNNDKKSFNGRSSNFRNNNRSGGDRNDRGNRNGNDRRGNDRNRDFKKSGNKE